MVRLGKVSEGGIYCVILLYIMLFTQYSIILLKILCMVIKVINRLINMLIITILDVLMQIVSLKGPSSGQYWCLPLDCTSELK